MQELIKNVQKWANDKGLNKPKQAQAQLLKFLSEYGETCDAILHREKNGDADLIDGFGDIIVTLIVLAEMRSVEVHGFNYKPRKINGANELYFGVFTRQLSDLVYTVLYEKDDKVENAIERTIMYLCGYIADAGFTPEQCLAAAYSEIKDRKGKLVGNTFVKEK